MLCSASVQEEQDFALIAHSATLESRIPFIHFFDGYRTSHEVAKIELLDESDMAAMISDERIMEHRLATAQAPAAWAAQAAAGVAFDAYDRRGAIRAPVLVQHGDEDVVVDPRNGELLAERLREARLERFPGTGHLFFWERPERFVASVTSFLEAQG